MERDYLAAALPEPFTILGQRLTPFSLGHLLLLRRFDNAFVVPGGSPSLDDLAFAVFVCADSYEVAVREMAAPDVLARVEEWGRNLGPFVLDEKVEEFNRYLIAGSQGPEANEDGQTHRQPGAPFIHRVRMVLQGRLNYSFSDAMNCPWGLALWDYFGFWEMEGAVKLFSEEDAERIAMAKALRETISAEGGWTLLPVLRDGELRVERPEPLSPALSPHPMKGEGEDGVRPAPSGLSTLNSPTLN